MFADVFVLLLIAHYAGDFMLQTDRMSERKADRSREGWHANITHVLCHLAATFALLGVANLATGLDISVPAGFGAAAWIGISHGLIDRRWPVQWWMEHTGSGNFFKKGGAPLVDQAMHVCLGLTPAALLIAALS
jgi:hypothetical protein